MELGWLIQTLLFFPLILTYTEILQIMYRGDEYTRPTVTTHDTDMMKRQGKKSTSIREGCLN